MSLTGNLREFPILQLLNLISIARKSGMLIVEDSNNAITIFFHEGKLIYAEDRNEQPGLLAILQKAHKLSVPQYRVIKDRTRDMEDLELGLFLMHANYLSRQDIISTLQEHYIGIVNRLFTWSDGFFRFENETASPKGKLTVRVNLENLILEGSQRMEEWERLLDEMPSLNMALKFKEQPDPDALHASLSTDEWRVIKYVNPKNTMAQIAKALQLSEFEIRHIVHDLLHAGLIEMVNLEEGSKVAPRQEEITDLLKPVTVEQKSFFQRIIDRFHSR